MADSNQTKQPEIRVEVVPYHTLKGHKEIPIKDDYDIAAYILSPSRQKTYLSNPYLTEDFKFGILLGLADEVIVGRSSLYPILFKKGDEILPAFSGSALEVHEDYRKYAVGAEVFAYPFFNKAYNFFIASGISDIALPLYRKLRHVVFAFPRMMMLCNARCILQSKGLKGISLKCATAVSNLFVHSVVALSRWSANRIARKFTIEQLQTVPKWAEDMVINDGHKYMEVHDQQWLQWNLDNNFRGLAQDKQAFFAINQTGKPLGFFMIKERFKEIAGGALKDVVIGSIVEWATADATQLSEADICKIALTKFSRNIDIVEFATTDDATLDAMKRFGFLQHGQAHIAFKDMSKECKDAKDINLWRIRYGYADVILT